MIVATPTRSRIEDSAVPAPHEQLYFTHCLYDEGLIPEAGFGVRASSTRDPLILRCIQEYPLYELPAGLRTEQAEPPRRLALVRLPGGRSALIHSVAQLQDDRGRANNFFSHVIVASRVSPREALASWASADWVSDCSPNIDKDIATLDNLPTAWIVGDRALTAFLRETDSSETLSCPPRLANDRGRRRRLLSLALHGCLLTLQAGPTDPRGRFYLLAEPELVALLLYGAARLLPQAVVQGLTFSTYESASSVLRSYRQTQVVGTWLADPGVGLSEEFYTERGYALDTVNDKWSGELTADSNPALEEWLELATRGEWGAIDRLHGLLGETTASVVAYTEGVQAARLVRRLSSGRADLEDVLSLKRFPWGASILEQQQDDVWPIILDACLADPGLCAEFADLLRGQLPKLEAQAARALRQPSRTSWQPYWRLLWMLLQDNPFDLRNTLERILPEMPCSSELCFAILEELQPLHLSVADPRVPLQTLLKHFDAEQLAAFACSSLPREWFVWAVCHALVRSDTRDAAARYLHESEDVVRVFWQQFKLLKDPSQRRAILSALIATVSDQGPAFLDRMLSSGCSLPPDTLSWLLEALGAWKREWADYWGRDDHLGQLLVRVRVHGAEGAPIWERFCGEIDRGVLPPGDPYQHTLLMNLSAVAKRPGPPLPPASAAAITDWSLLRDHFEKASAVPPADRPAIIAACNRRGLDPMAELTTYFTRYIQPQPLRDELLDDFAGFFHSFYLEPVEFPDHEARLGGWLQLVAGCPDEPKKEAYQRYYLDCFVPQDFQRRLVEEMHRAGKLLSGVAAGPAPPPKTRSGVVSAIGRFLMGLFRKRRLQ